MQNRAMWTSSSQVPPIKVRVSGVGLSSSADSVLSSAFKTPSPTHKATLKQDSFKKKLRRRCLGTSTCEICGDECCTLMAARLVDHALKKQLEVANLTDSLHLPISVNEAANGLLLCPTCHSHFDFRPPFIRVQMDGTITLTGAAKKQKYKSLYNTKVPWADRISQHKDYPSKELLQLSTKLIRQPRKRARESSSEKEDDEDEDESEEEFAGRKTRRRVRWAL